MFWAEGRAHAKGWAGAAWGVAGTAEAIVPGTEAGQSSYEGLDQRDNMGLDIGMTLTFT